LLKLRPSIPDNHKTVLTLRMLIRWRTLLELLHLSSKKNMNITILISSFKTYVPKNSNEVDRYPIKPLEC
jgi:hypothetical protein